MRMLQSRLFVVALGFFAATTTGSSADHHRLVDPTFFVPGGPIAHSYDSSSNEFDPPLLLSTEPASSPATTLLDMAFEVGNDNPYLLVSASDDHELTLYSVFTGYEHAYEHYLPEGWDSRPRFIHTIRDDNDASGTVLFALSGGGVHQYLASTTEGGDAAALVRMRSNNYQDQEDPESVLAEPFTVVEDGSLLIPGGVTAMAFAPMIKNTNSHVKLALGRPDGVVEVYHNKHYQDFPLTKAAEVSAAGNNHTDGGSVEKIGFSHSYSLSPPLWMAVVHARPAGNSGLTLYVENNYVAPRTAHVLPAQLRDLVFSHDNSKLAVLLTDGTILVYGGASNNNNHFDTRLATLPANATALAFHAKGALLYAGTSAPARVTTYSTTSWEVVSSSSADDSAALTFGDAIHKMIFRPVRSELEANYGITALWREEEHVVHELALLTSKEDGTVPDLMAVFRVETSDPPSAITVVPTMVPTVTTAAPTTASGAMLPQSKRERTMALVALILLGCTMI